MSKEKQIITAATALQNRQLLSALENLAVWDEGSPCFCHVHGGGGLNALATLNTIAIATRRVQQSRNPNLLNNEHRCDCNVLPEIKEILP